MAATAGTACPAAARPATATRRPSLPAPAAAATPRTPSPGWNARVPPPRTAPDCMSSGALMSSVSGRALRPAYSTLRPAPVDGVSMSSKCRAGLCGDPMVADVPTALFHALGVGRAFTAHRDDGQRQAGAGVSMPSVSGGRLQGSPNLRHLSWVDGSTCERSAAGACRRRDLDMSRYEKRLLTCVRALPGSGEITAALAGP